MYSISTSILILRIVLILSHIPKMENKSSYIIFKDLQIKSYHIISDITNGNLLLDKWICMASEKYVEKYKHKSSSMIYFTKEINITSISYKEKTSKINNHKYNQIMNNKSSKSSHKNPFSMESHLTLNYFNSLYLPKTTITQPPLSLHSLILSMTLLKNRLHILQLHSKI